MIYYTILSFMLFLVLGTFSTSKEGTKNTNDLKQEAKDFALGIIQTYFSEDCDKLYNAMSDSVLFMDGDGIIAKAGKEKELCESVKSAINDKEKTFQDYIDMYTIDILTPEEFIKRFKPLPDYYKITEFDFFFLGYELKEDKQSDDDFIWDDMFIFMVRKENGVWMIKGVSK